MAEGDGTTVHVYFFGIEFELASDGDGGDGEGFVKLDEVNIFMAVPAGFGEEFFDGVYRRHHDPFGFDAANSLGNNSRDWLLAKYLRVPFARDDDGGGAVVSARGVADRDGAVFFEGGF